MRTLLYRFRLFTALAFVLAPLCSTSQSQKVLTEFEVINRKADSGLYSDALKLGLERLLLSDSVNDQELSAWLRYRCADLTYQLHDKEGALQLISEIHELEFLNSDSVLLQKINRLAGGLYFELNLPDSALYYLRRSAFNYTAQGDVGVTASAYGMIGEVYSKTLAMYDSAAHFYSLSLKAAEYSGDSIAVAYALIRAGTFETQYGDCERGKPLVERAYQFMLNLGNTEGEMWALQGLAAAHRKCGSMDSAYKCLVKVIERSKNIFNENSSREAALYKEMYDTKSKEYQLQLSEQNLQVERQQNTTLIVIFLSLLVVGVVLLILFTRRNKHKREMELVLMRDKERNRIARELHDNVGSTVSFIISKTEGLSGNDHRKEDVHMIHNSAKEVMAGLRETLWTLNNQSIANIDLADKLKLYIKQRLLIEYQIEDVIQEERIIPNDAVLALYRCVQEIINNANRHSKASQVRIRFSDSVECRLKIEITDNGVGIQSERTGEHYGLSNLKERMKEVSAQLLIKSADGQGTSVIIIYT